MKAKRISLDALLTALALTIFTVELQIPSIVPIPGVKLGLANIITIFAIFLLGPVDTAYILLARIFLGGLLSGRVAALIYSFSGGVLCYAVMQILHRIVTEKQIWVCSVIGAIAHNTGQIAAAIFVTGTWTVVSYLPVLMVSGICAGACTGLAAQLVVRRSRNLLARRKQGGPFT